MKKLAIKMFENNFFLPKSFGMSKKCIIQKIYVKAPKEQQSKRLCYKFQYY